MAEWFEASKSEVMSGLGTGMRGLESGEAARRLKQYGENVIEESGQKQWWQVFLGQFQDLLVVILIVAAGISMVTGDPGSAGVIFTVLLLNACLGTVQQQKAEKSLESLKNLSAPMARVRRDNRVLEIPSSQVVPGDILILGAGDLVAADARILEVHGLQVNESSLTGESANVEKQDRVLHTENGKSVALADRVNMVFSGSLVTGGRAEAVVVATGMQTQIGAIASMMNQTEGRKTPLQISLDRFSARLAAAILVICALVFALCLYRKEPILDALMFSVALAVAAIPEALSSIVTIVQAMGTQKMAAQNAIIKDLKAVESLGCVSVICSDKTGTLTQNRMQTERVWLGDGEHDPMWLGGNAARRDVARFLLCCALNNDAQSPQSGDPMEQALLAMAKEAGIDAPSVRDRFPRLGELPFDSVRKRMATKHEMEGRCVTFLKGAPEIVLSHCTQMAFPMVRSMSERDRKQILSQNLSWSEKGLRVLAFAYLESDDRGESVTEEGMVFLGMAAMMDPPRVQSKSAVASAARAGIRTVMITGDQKVTAMAIARRLGILRDNDQALTGSQLEMMDEAQLDRELTKTSVYARVSPAHKIRIVKAWQKRGNIVAMTGDGVNDAPALKQADIGVAMGQMGTEVSKEAASMILADDNFATIIKAVANGRNVYRNIKNAIQFLLSGNMAGIFCVLYTSFFALPMPFAPVHLLFINLLTDSLPAIAIGMEPAEDGLLREMPRNPKEGILTLRFVRDILVQGGLIACSTMYAYHTGLVAGGAAAASTMAFSTLTLARLFHGFNCRSRRSILRLGLLSNVWSLLAFELGAILLGAVLFVPGLQGMFAAADLMPRQVFAIVLCACAPTFVIQIFKCLRECVNLSES